ncbi:hypothetical protein EDB86DRAFT_2827437 [Lactarius hatsudake]|nr:hypothetical protein EDB86DRAFT_2827437 [Lactarius hatsudake]
MEVVLVQGSPLPPPFLPRHRHCRPRCHRFPPPCHYCHCVTIALHITVAATLRVTVTIALHFTATVALRDVVVIDLVAVVVGVVAADCTLCGVALWCLLRAVGGGSGGGLVCGDELEAAATGLCAARWRRRWRWGLEGSPSIALGGVGAKGQGMVAWWIVCLLQCCPWSRGGGPRAKAIPGREPLEE